MSSFRTNFLEQLQDIISASTVTASDTLNKFIYSLIYDEYYADQFTKDLPVQLYFGKVVDDLPGEQSGKIKVKVFTRTKYDPNANDQDGLIVRPLAALRSFYKPKKGDIVPLFILESPYVAFYLPSTPDDSFFEAIGIDPTESDVLLLTLNDSSADNPTVITKFIYDRSNNQYVLSFENGAVITITADKITFKRTDNSTPQAVARANDLATEINTKIVNFLNNSWLSIFNAHTHTVVTGTGTFVTATPIPQFTSLTEVNSSAFDSDILDVS